MNCSLIVGAIVPQLNDPVETVGAVALTQEVVIELHGLCDMRELVPVDPRPERRHNGVGHLAAPGFVSDFAAGESKPLPATIVAFEVPPGGKWDEKAGSRECA